MVFPEDVRFWLLQRQPYLLDLFRLYIEEFHAEVPMDYLLHHLVGSFAETVKWWVSQDMTPDPEKVAGYYMAVNGTHEMPKSEPYRHSG